MEYVSIPQLEKKASRFVMGTFGMFPDENIEQHMSVLDAAFELGINTIDTARAYDSEPTVGRWMRERGNREKIVLISKGAHPSPVRERVTPYDIDSDLFETLATLGTDYLDIYMLHRDNTELPVGPIVEKLNEHHAAGRIRCFGGSNWTDSRLNEANEYAYAHNLIPMSVSSPNYSLAEQVENPWAPGCVTISGPQNEKARAWYEKNQMPVFAYSSLARGLFPDVSAVASFRKHQNQSMNSAAKATAMNATSSAWIDAKRSPLRKMLRSLRLLWPLYWTAL